MFDNVALPLRLRGASERDTRREAFAVLEWLDVAHLADKRPGTLSGGEQQRAAIARALIGRPEVLLADEPTNALEDAQARRLLATFQELVEMGTTVIVATHNEALVREAPAASIVLQDGTLAGPILRTELPHAGATEHERACFPGLRSGSLPLLVALMTLLAGLSLAGLTGVQTLAEGWAGAARNATTIEIPSDTLQLEDRTRTLIQTLHKTPDVTTVRELSRSRYRPFSPLARTGLGQRASPRPFPARRSDRRPYRNPDLGKVVHAALPEAVVEEDRRWENGSTAWGAASSPAPGLRSALSPPSRSFQSA